MTSGADDIPRLKSDEEIRVAKSEACSILKMRTGVGVINICFAGTANTGKSMLINGVRGLQNNHPQAAKVSRIMDTESITVEEPQQFQFTIGRHPDLYLWDIPGSGRPGIGATATDYFEKMHLAAFDHILIVCSSELMKNELDLYRIAQSYKIPATFVISKIDEEIKRMLDYDKNLTREAAKWIIIKEISKNFYRNSLDGKIFVVSSKTMQKTEKSEQKKMEETELVKFIEKLANPRA